VGLSQSPTLLRRLRSGIYRGTVDAIDDWKLISVLACNSRVNCSQRKMHRDCTKAFSKEWVLYSNMKGLKGCFAALERRFELFNPVFLLRP